MKYAPNFLRNLPVDLNVPRLYPSSSGETLMKEIIWQKHWNHMYLENDR